MAMLDHAVGGVTGRTGTALCDGDRIVMELGKGSVMEMEGNKVVKSSTWLAC